MKGDFFLQRFLVIFVIIINNLSAAPLSEAEVRKYATTIDRLLNLEYDRNGVKPNGLVSEEIFVRRAYLGIIGRIPTVDEATIFLTSKEEGKRGRLVDSLSASRGYESHQFNFLGDLLRLQTNRERHGVPWHLWIEKGVREDKPFDDFVAEMISAEGHATENPAVGYYLRDRGMLLDNVSNTVQTFLGVRIGCAQCHDHPFDDWTQREFFEIAAFSADVDYKSNLSKDRINVMAEYLRKEHGVKDPQALREEGMSMEMGQMMGGEGEMNEMQEVTKSKERKKMGKALNKAQNKALDKKQQKILLEARKAEKKMKSEMKDYIRFGTRLVSQNEIVSNEAKRIRYPHDYKYNDADPKQVVEAYTPFGDQIEEKDPSEMRGGFADWMTSVRNPYFAKTIANRLWKRAFGQGLAEPVDDWSSGDAVIPYPELLKTIGELMVAVDFDLRQFQRVLWHTELFQRESVVEDVAEAKPHDFSGPLLRRMTAEQLLDSLLTLYVGNPDEMEDDSIEEVRAAHSDVIRELKSMSGEELVKMVDLYKKSYEKAEVLKNEGRQHGLKLREAVESGNKAMEKELQQVIRELRRQEKELMTKKDIKLLYDLDRGALKVSFKGDLNNQTLTRISKRSSPMPPNAFVRQFGSSDRKLTDNANTQATIPQVLNLMNGHVTGNLSFPKAQYQKDLIRHDLADDRLSHFYLAMYAAMPTAEERREFKELLMNGKTRVIFSRAAINSKRFLFIE